MIQNKSSVDVGNNDALSSGHSPTPSTAEQRALSSLATAEENLSQLDRPCASRLKLTMVTPWKQECGNAEYAERLCWGLETFAQVTPVDLRNFMDDFELRSQQSIRQHFENLLSRIQSQPSDVVHIQHEFCFFGRTIQRSNAEFLKLVQKIRKPIVVTLHTWLDRDSKKKIKLSKILRSPLEYFRASAQRRNLYKALCLCDAIVVHTHDTYAAVVTAFPKLRDRIKVIHIPIAPVDSSSEEPILKKSENETWMVLPGFVSPYKGHSHAVHALELLPKEYKLVVAGGRHPKDRNASRYWMDLLQLIELKGLQTRVLFTGFLPSAGQAAILKQADLFLLPYDEVGQSGSAVLADSLAYGCPVITSKARSMFAYRMSHDTVYCCTSTDVGQAEMLSECIVRATEKTQENQEIAKQREAARKRYSLNAIGQAYERLYKDVVRSKQV